MILTLSPSFALLLFSLLGQVAVTSANLSDCVTAVEDGKDYFPDKVSPSYSKEWSITYHGTYKILRNHFVSATYVLYQCGTTPPTGISDVNLTIPVPVQGGFAVSSTPMIPHVEIMGLGDQLKAYLGDSKWISAPCINDRIASGELMNIMHPNDDGVLEAAFAETGNLLTFVNPTPSWVELDIKEKIYVNEYMEKTNPAIGEWLKYYAVFFNKEAGANTAFDATRSRFECTAKNAEFLLTSSQDKPKPVVVWAEFSTYCGGWSVGSCPNHYCEFITTCAASMLSDDDQGSIINPACGSKKYKTLSEFVEFAKDADVWIYPGHRDYYFELAYEEFKEDLDKLKSVQNKKVYDTVKTGLNTWYEHRLVEYGKL